MTERNSLYNTYLEQYSIHQSRVTLLMKQTLYPQPTTAECGFKLFRFKIYNFAFVGEAIPKLEIGGIKAYVRLQTFF